jgi:ribonuclease HI
MHFSASKNAAEYKALIHGLRMATALGICWLKVLRDSLLVVNQDNKEWPCLDDKMLLYCQELRELENNFDGHEYLHILQGKNEITDELAKLGSSRAMVPIGVFLQEHHEPSNSEAIAKETPPLSENITESPEVLKIHSDWYTSFMYISGPEACQRTRSSVNDYVIGQDNTLY